MLAPINVSLDSLHIETLIPMLIAIGGALTILVADLAKKNLDKSLYIMMTVVFLLLDLGALFQTDLNQRGFFDVMLVDGLAVLGQLIVILGSLLFVMLSFSKKSFHEYLYAEYFAFYLFMVAGFQFMVATDNLILIFVGLETSSLALYTMIAMHNRATALEAAVKYFTMGALSAGMFAFGSMILYALSGSVEISKIAEVMTASGFEPMALVIVATAFMIGAFGFKMALVPFHTWVPDVYEGSTAALAGFMSIVPKIAGLVVTIRLFEFLLQSGIVWVEIIIYALVVLTMTLANIWALVQNDVKRMLAYSSISHAGFVMAAVLIGTTHSNSALFIYWFLFLFTNLGAFAMLWSSRSKTNEGRYDHTFEKFSGLIKTMPLAAFLIAIFMLSLAGVPPFSMFFGKMYMISSAVTSGYMTLAIIMALNSAIAAYYYLKIIFYMFFKEPLANAEVDPMGNATLSVKSVIGIAAFFAIFGIFFVNPIMEMVTYFVYTSGY